MRRKIASAAVGLLIVISGASSGARSMTSQNSVHGYFSLTGRVPAAFRNIDHLNLLIPAYVDSATPNAPDHGRIRLKGRYRTDYVLLEPTLSGNHLSFKTKAVRGVRYEFGGTLTRTNFDEPQPGADEVVLRGTLVKIKAGRTVARAVVAFTWELGD